MKNEKLVKFVGFFILPFLFAVMVFGLTSCKENIWKPSVQGSHVLELAYEEIGDEYIVEKFSNFSQFSKSSWAEYYFSPQAIAKEERYSKEYFKNSDLITIKFNMPESGIEFTVIDVVITNNICTVVLLPVKKISTVTEQPTTYCCFVETSADVSKLQIELKLEETVLHESQAFSYITNSNEHYIFENKVTPTVFVINDKNGVDQFIEYDEVLSKQSYVYVSLRNYNDNIFEQYSLVLVRLFSSDFEEVAVYCDGNKLNIVGTYSNHYKYENATPHHKLVALLVDKNTNINEISRTIYYEYEDNLDVKSTSNNFSISEQSNIAENVTMHSFTHDYD